MSDCLYILLTVLFVFFFFSYFSFSVAELGKQCAEKVSIKDLNALVMLDLCKKLNIESPAGCDYKYLAAHFGMSWDDIKLISQEKDRTQEILKWIGQTPQNTVAKLREILVKMERNDCVAIIDEKYKCEVCLVWISSEWRISIIIIIWLSLFSGSLCSSPLRARASAEVVFRSWRTLIGCRAVWKTAYCPLRAVRGRYGFFPDRWVLAGKFLSWFKWK